MNNLTAVSHQIGLVDDNRGQLKPAVDQLNGVLGILDNRKQELQRTLYLLRRYAMSFGEVLGSGPFFKASVVNLIPGQFSQPFIDAAFSDLGLDPNVLLPDAITGNPGDPRYPYREPLPAPPPGGPPPGPPALPPPGSGTPPGPTPFYVPAPGEVPPPSFLPSGPQPVPASTAGGQ